MRKFTRRDMLKTGMMAAGGAMLGRTVGRFDRRTENGVALSSVVPSYRPTVLPSFAPDTRDRLLLDFDWRFHLGHAADPAQDFGFGRGNDGAFAKTGYFFAPGRPDFDAGAWRAIDLPHDWAVDLPFVHDPDLTSHGFKPIGRAYPATSVGWYRKVFAVPAADAGRRLWLEFDGVYRNAIVTLNDAYLTTAVSGYAPFRVDVTDLVRYGGDNVLVLRVDATENEGWFYEGAGIYRHVWLVKTAPLHVPQWGTYVTTEFAGRAARVHVHTDVVNDGDHDAPCTVVSRRRRCRRRRARHGAHPVARAGVGTGDGRSAGRTRRSAPVVHRIAVPVPAAHHGRGPTAARWTSTRRRSACAPCASTPSMDSCSMTAAWNSRARATIRTTPAWAPPCPTGSRNTASPD